MGETFKLPLIATFTGKLVNPLDLKPEDIDIIDIAHATAGMGRYTCHTRYPESVATHSVLLHDYAEYLGWPQPKLKKILMHDATEAYCIDLPAPLKFGTELGKLFQEIEEKIELVICKKFGIDPMVDQDIKNLDRRIRTDEIAQLFDIWLDKTNHGPALGIQIPKWTQKRAKKEFLRRCKKHKLY